MVDQHPILASEAEALGITTRGFTLIEILIIVAMLGILGAMVLPKFSDAYTTTTQNTLKDEVRYLRTQIAVYKAQHRNRPPGYPAGPHTGRPTASLFYEQMTGNTNDLGESGANPRLYGLGPYLKRMPVNPINGLATVLVVPDDAALPVPDNSTGWIYKPKTLEIIPNLPGTDRDGTPYASY